MSTDAAKRKKVGFFSRVREGTWMGHVIEHIALEIQTLAGMDTGFGRTRESSTKGVYHVVFSYWEKEAGVYAAKAAVSIAEALIAGTEFDLAAEIQKLREMREEERLGPSTGSIVEEAIKHKIPYIRLNKRSARSARLWRQSEKNTSDCSQHYQQYSGGNSLR